MIKQVLERPPLEVTYHDDPKVVEEAATDDYSLHIVPPTWRISRGQLTMAWYGVATAFFYIYFASFMALAYGTWNAIIGLVLTVAVFTAVNMVLSRAASKTGLTVALFSRSMFGFVGASIAAGIFAATAIYYVVFEGSVVAVAAQGFFGGPIKLWYAIVILLMIPLVWRGIAKWLDRLNGVLLPMFIVGMVAVIVWALTSKGYHGFLPSSHALAGTKLPWLQTFVGYMGVWVLMMYTFDFARLAKPEDQKYHDVVTFGWGYYTFAFLISGLIGIVLCSTFGITTAALAGAESALPVQIVGLTGLLGLLLIAITQMRINTVNLYLASTNLQSFFSRLFRLTLPRTVWVLVAAAIAYVLMLTNIFSYVDDALAYQGVAIVAWVGVALGHIWYLKRKGIKLEAVEFRPGRVPAANPGGLAAWLVATIVGVILKITEIHTGQFWPLLGLPITFVLAFGVYTFASGLERPSWMSLKRPFDPIDEVGDPYSTYAKCHVCNRSYLVREMDRDPLHDHQPICASCASGAAFQAAALAEARAD